MTPRIRRTWGMVAIGIAGTGLAWLILGNNPFVVDAASIHNPNATSTEPTSTSSSFVVDAASIHGPNASSSFVVDAASIHGPNATSSFVVDAASIHNPTTARTKPASPQELELPGGRRGFGGRGFPDRFREPTAFVPDWTIEPEFDKDVFTFARVEYTSARRQRGYRRGFYRWNTDWPDADNNFSYRLHELTSLRVNPQPVVVRLDEPEIFNYPFVYLVEAGHMALTEAEVVGLRKYLSRGGFLMVDDFWGDWALEGFLENLRRVFPNRMPVELPIEHEIFHIVYDIDQKPTIPSIHAYRQGEPTDFPELPDAYDAHYMGVFDDQGRMMIIICHNTDLGDGWEREGVMEGYFKAYSERWAYPLGINIVTYAMTH